MKKRAILVIFSLAIGSSLYAQTPKMTPQGLAFETYPSTETIQTSVVQTKPLRDIIIERANIIIPPKKRDLEGKKEEDEGWSINPVLNPADERADGALQTNYTKSVQLAISPIVNIDGYDYTAAGTVEPSDVNGEVGNSYYLQTVNASPSSLVKIYNKTGGVVGSFVTDNLWANLPVSGTGVSDPVVIFDQINSKWVMCEMISGNRIGFAVSDTENPLGTWKLTSISFSSLPDFPKISIWGNSIILTLNLYSTVNGVLSNVVYALDKNAFYNGQTVTVKSYAIPKIPGVSFQPSLCVDWDGSATASPQPVILRMYDGAWTNSGGSDHLEVWKINIDWSLPSGSTIVGPVNLNTSAFNSFFCNAFNCLSQPGTTQLLDVQAEYLNFRSQYRNFTSHESIVCTHAVNVGNGVAGIRWYELRKIGQGEWSIYQQGTYSPDTKNRFCGSIGIDAFGNIALGYNVVQASSTTYYSCRATGRLVTDPLGEMTFTELNIGNGIMSKTGFGRTGDYYSMAVDPIDGKTFWFTGEYAKASNNWGTKITSFVLQPTVVNSISINAPSSTTLCVNKNYSLTFTATGTYNAGNVFTAQLSNSAGAFTSPTNIGSLTSTTAGTMTINVPVGITPGGSAYRVRVVASNPPTTSGNSIVITVISANLAVGSGTVAPFEAVDNITTTSPLTISGNKTFKAGKSITINPSTSINIPSSGSNVFEAKIQACTY